MAQGPRLIFAQTTEQLLTFAQLQIEQFSENQTKYEKNTFAQDRIKRLVGQEVARLMRFEATDEQVRAAIEEFLFKIAEFMPWDDYFFSPKIIGPLHDGMLHNPEPINFSCCSIAQLSPRVRRTAELGLAQEMMALPNPRDMQWNAVVSELREKMAQLVILEESRDNEIDHGVAHYPDPVLRETLSPAHAFEEARNKASVLRKKLATMLRTHERRIVLTRNAGEAALLAACMAGMFEQEEPDEDGDDEPVVFGDDTQISVLLNMLMVGDAGNTEGRDPFSGMPVSLSVRGKQYSDEDVKKWLGKNAFITLSVRGKSPDEIKKEIKERFKGYHPPVVILSHVDRAYGRINDIQAIGKILHEHCGQPKVIVDGALAVGEVDINLNELFEGTDETKHIGYIDAYIGTLGKLMGAPSVGFLAYKHYFENDGIPRIQRAGDSLRILHGMFDEQKGIIPTGKVKECLSKGDLMGALEAIKELEDDRDMGTHAPANGSLRTMSVRNLSNRRKGTRGYLRDALENAFGQTIGIEFIEAEDEEHQATSILSFRLPRVDMRRFVERLQERHHVTAQYMSSLDCIRMGIHRNLRSDRGMFEQARLDTSGKMFVSDAIERMRAELIAMEEEGDLMEQQPKPVAKKAAKKKKKASTKKEKPSRKERKEERNAMKNKKKKVKVPRKES